MFGWFKKKKKPRFVVSKGFGGYFVYDRVAKEYNASRSKAMWWSTIDGTLDYCRFDDKEEAIERCKEWNEGFTRVYP